MTTQVTEVTKETCNLAALSMWNTVFAELLATRGKAIALEVFDRIMSGRATVDLTMTFDRATTAVRAVVKTPDIPHEDVAFDLVLVEPVQAAARGMIGH